MVFAPRIYSVFLNLIFQKKGKNHVTYMYSIFKVLSVKNVRLQDKFKLKFLETYVSVKSV